jgi:hypothetical protein
VVNRHPAAATGHERYAVRRVKPLETLRGDTKYSVRIRALSVAVQEAAK